MKCGLPSGYGLTPARSPSDGARGARGRRGKTEKLRGAAPETTNREANNDPWVLYPEGGQFGTKLAACQNLEVVPSFYRCLRLVCSAGRISLYNCSREPRDPEVEIVYVPENHQKPPKQNERRTDASGQRLTDRASPRGMDKEGKPRKQVETKVSSSYLSLTEHLTGRTSNSLLYF